MKHERLINIAMGLLVLSLIMQLVIIIATIATIKDQKCVYLWKSGSYSMCDDDSLDFGSGNLKQVYVR